MSSTKSKIALGLPIFFAAANMRAGFVLINPLVPLLKAHFDLSNLAISILAGIPLFCFALTSIFMSRISRLGSSSKIIKLALTALTIGLILRSTTGLPGLYIFTFLIGGSIAIMNYEIPAWIKTNASSDIGFMTGAYTTIMGVFGGIAIAVAVPLANLNNWNWKTSILPWIIVAGISTIFWYTRKNSKESMEINISKAFWRTPTLKNPLAWAMVCYFGFQSFTYFSTAAWLPTILTTKGFSLKDGALLVSITGILGAFVGLVAPHYISKYRDKRKILMTNSVIIGFGFVMTALQSGPILWLWLLIASIGMSVNFPMALTLTGLKTKNPEATRNLSTMMQSIGYVISAFGPVYVGGLFDISHSWNWAIMGVVLICLLQVVISYIVGKESYID